MPRPAEHFALGTHTHPASCLVLRFWLVLYDPPTSPTHTLHLARTHTHIHAHTRMTDNQRKNPPHDMESFARTPPPQNSRRRRLCLAHCLPHLPPAVTHVPTHTILRTSCSGAAGPFLRRGLPHFVGRSLYVCSVLPKKVRLLAGLRRTYEYVRARVCTRTYTQRMRALPAPLPLSLSPFPRCSQ